MPHNMQVNDGMHTRARLGLHAEGVARVERYTERRDDIVREGDKGRRIAVLFVCRHNAVRSQMAEALLRARFPERYEVASAGTAPNGVHPLTLPSA